MRLEELTREIATLEVVGDPSIDVTQVCIDSRAVTPGALFVAMRGTQVDGHRFIGKAIESGAVAVLCEELPPGAAGGATYVRVASTGDAVGPVATAFHGHPSRRLRLVGVTGTNGKTTTATLLYDMFRGMGHRCGLLSTVNNRIDGEVLPAAHTTPDAVELNGLLDRMARAGCEYAFMECSSHAIHQKRIGGLEFAGGVFTNLTRDHLDYHGTFEAYRDAKKAFFDSLGRDAFAITNADDRNGMVMVQNTRATVRTYSTCRRADFRARILESHFSGMYLEIDGREVGVQFIGRFNVSNLLGVYGAALMLGKDREEVLVALSSLRSVSGRLEPVHSPGGVTALVDYAHTPDALENVLGAIRDVLGKGGRIITVCGAGGNRDRGKRPLMAQEAAKRSDLVIITSDNPRFEDPEGIIRDMLAGLSAQQMRKVTSVTDRREAIRAACAMARRGDVILVAGKGHEDYQEIGGVRHHFDDKEILNEILSGK